MNILGNEYRIKEITYENGKSRFIGYEQRKFLFFTYWKEIKFMKNVDLQLYTSILGYTYEDALTRLTTIVTIRKNMKLERKIKQITYHE